MPRTYYIAAAAKTSIFMPLYFAKSKSYFNLLPKDVELLIEYPPSDVPDHDKWVHDQIVEPVNSSHPILFGVCDPYNALSALPSKLIGALVTKTAF